MPKRFEKVSFARLAVDCVGDKVFSAAKPIRMVAKWQFPIALAKLFYDGTLFYPLAREQA